MKVLFLTHYFPPEVNAPASRTYEHCRVWVEHGHEVSVLTCTPNHPAGKVYPGYRNRLWQARRLEACACTGCGHSSRPIEESSGGRPTTSPTW